MKKNVQIKNTQKHTKSKKLAIKQGAELAGVYKEKEFNDFVEWLSLPSMLKGRSTDYLEQIGVTDERAVELLQFKTMTAFAEKYKLEPSTLSEWKQKARSLGLLEITKDFFRGMTNNVYQAFYFETLKNGDAARVRLWEEIFNNKQPEGVPTVTQNILTPQFNQVIGEMRVEYKEKLRKYYEQQIKQSDGKVPGSK